jgi:hypothetical protein
VSAHDDGFDIPALLADRVLPLVCELLPGGIREGNFFRAGSVAGEKGQSLVVRLAGPLRGRWCDYADIDVFGDLVDLIAFTKTNRDIGKAFAWAREWLGLPPLGGGFRARHAVTGAAVGASTGKAAAEARRAREEAEARRHDAENRERGRRIWDQARPIEVGDPVDRYLKTRAIDLKCLGRGPAALRYVPSLWYGPKERFPAMVAAITDSRGEFLAVHRTWLKPQPDGSVIKAPVTEAKKTLGPYRGGAIRLWRGASAKPWAHMPMHSTVVFSEGIEDGLSALTGAEIAFPSLRPGMVSVPVAVSRLRLVCAVSLDNMAAIELVPQIDRVVILQQRDKPGSPAARKLDAITRYIEGQGVDVLLLPPPAWVGIKDINDVMRTLRVT